MKQHFLTDPDKIIIRKDGHELLIMSRFAPGTNMVIRFIEGNENSYFLPENAPLEDWQQGRLWTQSWDNNAPFFTGIHGIIGANHGSPYAFGVQTLRHWLFEKDIGSVFTDDAGNRFVLTSVESRSRIVLHSDVPRSGERFADKICGVLHGVRGDIVPDKVIPSMIEPLNGEQLVPHYRYNSVELYADGELLPDNETVMCRKAELRWDIDLILVDDWLEKLKTLPGKHISPVDPALPGAVNCRFSTVFRSRCSRTVDCDLVFLRDFPESVRFGVLQFYNEVKFAVHERLMPGIKPFTVDGMDIDLAGVFRFPENFRLTNSRRITVDDCADPARPADRSIDFYGNDRREIGAALGYSLTRGITARGSRERSGNLLTLPSTGKNYPVAFEKEQVKKGEKFRICCYQHYFAPDPSGVSCYQLEMEDGFFVYLDFPGKCGNFSVILPPEYAGKNFAVIEQDAAVVMSDRYDRVPADGILCFASTGTGSIVLQVISNRGPEGENI